MSQRLVVVGCALVLVFGAACSSSSNKSATAGGASGASTKSSTASSADAKTVADWEAHAADAWGDIALVQADAEVLAEQGSTGDQAQRREDCESRKQILATAKAVLLPVPAGTSASAATVQALPGQVERIEKLLESCLGNGTGAPALTAADIAAQEAITRDLEQVRQNAG